MEDKHELLSSGLAFKYRMLGRFYSDCEYYLGFGGRSANCLWAHDEKEQINLMRLIYNSFSKDELPNFITKEDIDRYEKEMCK